MKFLYLHKSTLLADKKWGRYVFQGNSLSYVNTLEVVSHPSMACTNKIVLQTTKCRPNKKISLTEPEKYHNVLHIHDRDQMYHCVDIGIIYEIYD